MSGPIHYPELINEVTEICNKVLSEKDKQNNNTKPKKSNIKKK